MRVLLTLRAQSAVAVDAGGKRNYGRTAAAAGAAFVTLPSYFVYVSRINAVDPLLV